MHSDWVTLDGQPRTHPQGADTASTNPGLGGEGASAAWGWGLKPGATGSASKPLGSVRGFSPVGYPDPPQHGERRPQELGGGPVPAPSQHIKGNQDERGALAESLRAGTTPAGTSPQRGTGVPPHPQRRLRASRILPRPHCHVPLGVLPWLPSWLQLRLQVLSSPRGLQRQPPFCSLLPLLVTSS